MKNQRELLILLHIIQILLNITPILLCMLLIHMHYIHAVTSLKVRVDIIQRNASIK